LKLKYDKLLSRFAFKFNLRHYILGGHAIYIDAAALLPGMPKHMLPGHAVACALYVEGGVRSCEIGTLMFGAAANKELVRMAIPRRMYTQSHVDYAVEVCARVAALAAVRPLRCCPPRHSMPFASISKD